MTPFFTSDFSIGRSILKVSPSKTGTDDILSLAKEADLKEVFLVEDTMIGFLESYKVFSKEGISLRFGVRFNMCNDVSVEDKSGNSYKLILFALNDEGCKTLYKIFSAAFTKYGGFLDCDILKSFDLSNILLVHPFYDSYLFHNTFYFKNCVFFCDGKIQQRYTIEDNLHPFDGTMSLNLHLHWQAPSKLIRTKTILYKNRDDADAYQVYRMACNRSFGREQSLSAPNIDHFGSREFCFQSYMENRDG